VGGEGVVLSERVCDGGIRWLAPSNKRGKEGKRETKDWKGGVWVGMGMPLVVLGDGGERGGERRCRPLLVCCGTAGSRRLRLLSCVQMVGFVIPSPFPPFQIFVPISTFCLLVFSLYLSLEVFSYSLSYCSA
jgi:hypothetical protein